MVREMEVVTTQRTAAPLPADVVQRMLARDVSAEIERIDIALEVPTTATTFAFTLEHVFNEEECAALIAHAEAQGFEPALVNIGYGRQQKMSDVRNGDRVIIDDEGLASVIMARIAKFVPRAWPGTNRRVVGLNERLRILRYDAGGFFAQHYDGHYTRSSHDCNDARKIGDRSFVTVQFYLNEGFDGGETTFLGRGRIPCVPRTGQILIFTQDLLHEGSLLRGGRKYTIRTDVMYHAPSDDAEVAEYAALAAQEADAAAAAAHSNSDA